MVSPSSDPSGIAAVIEYSRMNPPISEISTLITIPRGADRDAFRSAARGQPAARQPADRKLYLAAAGPKPARFLPLPPAAELIGRDADLAELAELLTAPLPAGPSGLAPAVYHVRRNVTPLLP